MDLRETYNKIAEDWYAEHKQDSWWIEGTDHFISLLKKGNTVIDVGCGAGFKSKYLTDKGLVVTGIDFSEKFIEVAKQKSPDVEFIVMDMKDAGTLDRQFDAVFAQASLLHISKKEIAAVLKSLAMPLKPQGYLYIAVKGKRPGGAEEAVLEESNYGYPYSRFFSYFTMDELKHYLRDLEMKIVFENSKIVGRTEWLQIIGRKAG